MRALRLLFGLLGWVLILVLLAIAGAVALIATEDGTRWLFAQAERHAPVEFQAGRVDGTLFRGLTLHDLSVDAAGTRVELSSGLIELDALALLRLTVHVRDLDLAGLVVDLPEADPEPPEPTATPELPETVDLPVRVQVDRFRLADLDLRRLGETLLAIDHLALRLQADADGLQLADVELALPGTEVWLDAGLQPAGAWPLSLEGRWRVDLPEAVAQGLQAERAEGRLVAAGDLRERLQLHHNLQAGAAMETDLVVQDLLGTPRFDLQNRWDPFHYRLDAETAQVDAGELRLHGDLDAWDARLATAVQWGALPVATLNTAIAGSLRHVEIMELAVRSVAGELEAQGRLDFAETLAWTLDAGLHHVAGDALGLEMDAAVESLQLAATGRLPRDADADLEGLLQALSATIEIRELLAQVDGQPLAGSGRVAVAQGQARIDDLLLQLGPEGSVRVDGDATLGAEIPFRLALAADALDLGFLMPERELALPRLRLRADGRLEPETGALEATAMLEDLVAHIDGQALSASADVALSETRARIRTFDLALPADGRLNLRGQIGFGAGIDWDLQLAGQGIDPGVLVPDLPGRLKLDLDSRGALAPDGVLEATLELRELSGELRSQPVQGVASTGIADSLVRVDALDLQVGANRLSASGELGDVLALELALHAPELDRVLPALGGRIELDAKVSGTPDSPRIAARGEGHALRYDELQLERLDLQLDAGLDPEAPAELALRLADLRAGGQHIGELRLDADGKASAHRLELAVEAGDLGRLRLQAAGGYDLEQALWNGRLERLDLEQAQAGRWALRQPVPVTAGPAQANLGELCLGRDDANLCLSGDWAAAAGGQGQVTLQDLDLAWLEPVLPPQTAIEGRLNARLEAAVDAAEVLRGELSVTPTDGQIRLTLPDGSEQVIPYRDLRLSARIDDQDLRADLGLSFLDEGTAHAAVQMRPEDDSYRIDGGIHAALDSLEWIGAFSPEIQNVRGQLHADLELGGRLDAPLVQGSLRIGDAGVQIPEAGLDLELPRLVAEVVSAEEMHLSGELRSGGESLQLEGHLGFAERQPEAELRIHGERFLAVNRPDIRARISPDLTLRLRPERLTVRGEVLVPTARILPPDLPPGSVGVSRDEVVVGAEADPANGLPMDIRVRVVLGDDVRFDGFGLVARFTGDLDVVDVPERPLQLFGDVNIPEGSYEAYGQDLVLEHGLVIFQGPVESPALDLRAVRRVPAYDVVVGLEIGGVPDELSSRVFSEPPMDDTEAMAFLLTGRPLSGATQSDGNLIAGAAAAWGLEQGDLITQRLGHELGLDEVELDTDAGLDQSALTIGKYLSPRLLLRYSMGLFDDSYKVMLRYELTRSLSVETTSSALGQGVDLIYRIER
ncbi:translocation/assembly module TamB domain-containing protein [Thioalkalivibrio paradoxus]|uniref:Translocation and assembly module TamB C-terminal domain-containing protein n=1 Tax=Thioalkalivibrio paradoxus ARh 1 TaxID=713585 RepID=W0DTG9_9GAMM|nr:translocation/assembly module TamB domain-containing protein [Thioalkalivibrio paradoxus]AHF00279.1 hypothetical protein THITH_15215 [Thioalkalivibrio paradoxus ARh 1]